MILVIGKGGQLGTAFANVLGPDAQRLGLDELDLRHTDLIYPTLDRFEPRAIINCAAHTLVDRAEDEPDLAMTLNCLAVGEMARWARSRSIPFVTYSTDYVFDGMKGTPYVESDETNPLNVYGRSKRAGELLALETHDQSLVVRTSWLVSRTHPNFVATIISKARQGPIAVVDDQIGVPNTALDLATASLEALGQGLTGVLHLSGGEPTTWFGLAQAALREADMDPSLVHPASTDDHPTKARRPMYGVLGSERETGIIMPSWRESLAQVVKEILTWVPSP